MAINKRFGGVGSLFLGTSRAKAIGDSCYVLQLCIHIHANPVKDALTTASRSLTASSFAPNSLSLMPTEHWLKTTSERAACPGRR
jgi:hypothetical protein